MTMEKYDNAIKQASHELEQARNAAESLVSGFKDTIAHFVIVWAQSLIKRAITTRPDVTKSLGKEKLAQMKTRFQTLLQAIPEKTLSELDKDYIWPHRTELPKDIESNSMSSYELIKKHSDSLDHAIRKLISDTGLILIEYGFSNKSTSDEWEQVAGRSPHYRYAIPDYGNPHASELKKLNEQYSHALSN